MNTLCAAISIMISALLLSSAMSEIRKTKEDADRLNDMAKDILYISKEIK